MSDALKRTPSERFMSMVAKCPNRGCWLWTGAKKQGYGYFYDGSRANDRGPNHRAHRWIYEHLVGPIPDGLQLDHLCRVRHCVNPAHLEPVTAGENIRRGLTGAALAARRLAMTHCLNGHPYSPDNTASRRNGWRKCLTCEAENRQRWNQRRRLAWRSATAAEGGGA